MSDVEIPAVRRLFWSVRRELWENQSIYMAPLIVAALILIGFGIALVRLPGRLRAASALGPHELGAIVEQPYLAAAIVLMVVDMLVSVFYCVDALYGERKDRSVLFWKSLPVSDSVTVLAKASIPIVVLPLVTFVATVGTHGLMLLASAAVLSANGVDTAVLWTHVPLLEAARIHLSHLLLFHGLWYGPLYAWLLLASAWATRLPFLWATLPPVAVGIVERIAFDSTHFATMLRSHFLGGPMPSHEADSMSLAMLAPHPLGHYLANPEFWVALLVTGLLLLAAVKLRRYRGVI